MIQGMKFFALGGAGSAAVLAPWMATINQSIPKALVGLLVIYIGMLVYVRRYEA